jgi:hypothetical protein
MHIIGRELYKNLMKSASKLKKELDDIFSKFIRERDKHICYTCGIQMEPSDSQCGHFRSRTHLITRFDEVNCHAQCENCNEYLKGNLKVYAYRLDRDYGKGTAELLTLKSYKTCIGFDFEYWKVIYTQKLKEIALNNDSRAVQYGYATD